MLFEEGFEVEGGELIVDHVEVASCFYDLVALWRHAQR
jgi:hypothetical protein